MPNNKDFPHWAYYSLLLICAYVAVKAVHFLPRVKYYRDLIAVWVGFSVDAGDKYVPVDRHEEYYTEIQKTMEETL